jgi:hypothetical protein
MDEFLRKIKLSEYAIEIYLRALGKLSNSYYELYSIIPKASKEQFEQCLNELINVGLLVKLPSKKHDPVVKYSILPPVLPILNYYENINQDLPNIKNSIQELMFNSVNRIIQENKVIELDTILKAFHEISKDIEEDSIIQKQEVEDIVEGMEELKKIKQSISDFHQDIKSITQTKFADLVKTINTIKSDLIENVKKKDTIALIEKLFKEKLDKMVSEFTNNLHVQIEKKFDEISKPIEKTTELVFQYRNDFKILLLNMLTNFETKLNKIHELLKENNEHLSVAINNLEKKMAENLNAILQNSINEISNLNKPIENVMKNYLQVINTTKNSLSNKVWTIFSVTRINEVIQNLILNSQENLIIIIPHLENHVGLEQFKTIPSMVKIKIISSEAHTNSTVKNFKNIKNIIYRTYQNENLIILKGDKSQFFFGIIQESKDPLNDFIGIGSNFKPLIELFDPLINNIWEKAYADTFHATQVIKPEHTTPTKSLTTAKPIIKTKMQPAKIDKKLEKRVLKEKKPELMVPSQKQEIPSKKPLGSITPKPQIQDLKEKLKEKIDFVAEAQPQADDEAAIKINNAFANLILKLNNLKGDEFGKELQDIADLILEKKGFSVTLHKIRSIINKFKEKLTLLDASDKREILENIENWKKKLY